MGLFDSIGSNGTSTNFGSANDGINFGYGTDWANSIGSNPYGDWGASIANTGNSGIAMPSSSWMDSVSNLPASDSSSGSGINWGGVLNGLTSGPVISAIAGGLLGSTSGAKQSGTATTTQAPWTSQQPYLMDLFNKAKQASTGGDASMSPYEKAALTGMTGIASGPTQNPYAGLDNPYLTSTINNASQDAMRNLMPAYDQAQISSGSFGNSGVADTFGRAAGTALGNIATNARMGNYNTQVGLAENAVNRTNTGLQNLYTAGQNSSANPWANLKNYAGVVTGNYGSTTSNPIFTNPTASALGGALTGANIYGLLSGGTK